MRLSVQLYTVRDALAADFTGTLRKLKDIGLECVELAGNLGGGTAAEGRAMLDDAGLAVSGAHVALERLTKDLDAVVEEALVLGCPTVIVPYLGEEDRKDYTKLAGILVPIAQRLKEKGLALAYHNHDFEFEVQNDEAGLDILYGKTDAALLKAELDLAWIAIAGQDPAAYVAKYAGRTPLVHLKDFDPSATPRWVPAGAGTMEWDAILEACRAAGVQYGAIELDEAAGDPIDAVKASFDYFSGKGLS